MTPSGTARKRSESKTLKRITDLFLGAKEKLSEEQIEVFDEVLCRLIARMEATALIELSERLAPINNAPTNVITRSRSTRRSRLQGPFFRYRTV